MYLRRRRSRGENLRAVRRDGIGNEYSHCRLSRRRGGGESHLLERSAKHVYGLIQLLVRHVAEVTDAEDGVGQSRLAACQHDAHIGGGFSDVRDGKAIGALDGGYGVGGVCDSSLRE